MPNQRSENPPAEHDEARDNADEADFEPANVSGLLRIVAVQKAPEKCGDDNGDPAGSSDFGEKWNGEKAEGELFVHGSKKADRNAGNPRKACVHRVGIVDVGGCPRAVMRGDNVKRDDETDMGGGQRDADDCGGEEFLGANASPGESFREA